MNFRIRTANASLYTRRSATAENVTGIDYVERTHRQGDPTIDCRMIITASSRPGVSIVLVFHRKLSSFRPYHLRLRGPQRTDHYKAFRGTYHTPRLIITEPHLKFVKEFEPMDAFAAFLRGIPTFAREVPRFSAFFRQKCGPI